MQELPSVEVRALESRSPPGSSVGEHSSQRPSQRLRGALAPLAALPIVALGIRVKLIGLMAGTIFLIVGVLASYFPTLQIAELRAGLRDRAAVYAGLAARQLRSSIAFGDQETAREVISAITKDPLIDGVALYTDQGARLHAEGALSGLAEQSRAGFGEARTFYLPGRVLATAPVKSLEGPTGTLVLELSTRSATLARDHLTRTALFVGICALLLGTVAAWLIARSLATRVQRIASAATAVANGDLEQTLDLDGPNDEIGVLAHGFSAMVGQLRQLIAHIRHSAREESERLERVVQQRTGELDRRNQDLRLVLDNVEQGFVTIDRNATVIGEFSRVVADWLGPLATGVDFWGYLERSAPGLGAELSGAWGQVTDGLLPLELTLDQMPARLRVGSRHLRIGYTALGGDDFEKLLVVISDVTAIFERERSEREERDLLNVVSRLLHDRAGFLEFFAETQNLIVRIADNRTDLVALKRDLHTLKGNSAIYGLSGLSETCHNLESELEALSVAELNRAPLKLLWDRTYAKIKQLLGERDHRHIEVDESEYVALLDAVRRGVDPKTLARMLEAWRLEPLKARLDRVGEQLAMLAMRLGKGPIEVLIDAPHLYLARGELSEFWSVFAHVVRNAVVHGLEGPELRASLGKTRLPRFELRAGIECGRLFVEIEDPGPGIDWEAVRARALEQGLPHATDPDLHRALFLDGLSTATSASESSGRGVGLSAVREVCERQHGVIDVTSTRGKGACFRFSWPTMRFQSLSVIDLGIAC